MTTTLDNRPAICQTDVTTEALSAQPLDALPCNCISANREFSSLGTWGGARAGSGRKPREEIVYRPLGLRWFVFQTFPQCLPRASRDLAERGYRVEVPMQLVRDRSSKNPRAGQLRPMFDLYGFVELDGGDGWVGVREADGVRRVFTTPQMVPLPVPVGFVEMLIETAPERLKLPDVRLPAFPAATLLRVTQGPLEGHVVRCVRSDGLTSDVDVELMGRTVRAAFSNASLAMWDAGATAGLVP